MNPALRKVILEFASLRRAADVTGVCHMKLHRLIKSLKEGGLWDEMVASMRAAAPPAPAIETAATLPPTALSTWKGPSRLSSQRC